MINPADLIYCSKEVARNPSGDFYLLEVPGHFERYTRWGNIYHESALLLKREERVILELENTPLNREVLPVLIERLNQSNK